jgi:hypothetical protein
LAQVFKDLFKEDDEIDFLIRQMELSNPRKRPSLEVIAKVLKDPQQYAEKDNNSWLSILTASAFGLGSLGLGLGGGGTMIAMLCGFGLGSHLSNFTQKNPLERLQSTVDDVAIEEKPITSSYATLSKRIKIALKNPSESVQQEYKSKDSDPVEDRAKSLTDSQEAVAELGATHQKSRAFS